MGVEMAGGDARIPCAVVLCKFDANQHIVCANGNARSRPFRLSLHIFLQ